jgi:hypothetical protein
MSSFSDHLDRLWELQELDRRIIASRERVAADERRIAEKHAQARKVAARESAAKDELRHMQSREHEIEDELRRLDARIKQIEFVPGSEAAIEKHREMVGELEGEGIDLLSAMTEKKGEIERIHAEAAALAAAAEELKSTVEAKRAAEGETLQREQQERERIAAEVPDEMLRVYESIAQRHPGTILTRAAGEFCAACSGELTMHLVVRAKARTEIVRCQYCSRILDPAKP